jgi:hypothetical protein
MGIFSRFPNTEVSPKGSYSASQTKKAELHAENGGGIDRYYADRLPCRPGQASSAARSLLPMESTMFASENCSKAGCFVEAALPAVGPVVALIWMLSIAAFSCWAM